MMAKDKNEETVKVWLTSKELQSICEALESRLLFYMDEYEAKRISRKKLLFERGLCFSIKGYREAPLEMSEGEKKDLLAIISDCTDPIVGTIDFKMIGEKVVEMLDKLKKGEK